MLTTDPKKLQLVVSIALIDSNDQILISKRPDKKHLSGYWEFPGGKVEKNETPQNAIIREVKEELNVDQDVADVLAREGFSSIDEIAYCSIDEFDSIDDFDEELIQELRKRASEKIEAKNKKIEQENSLVGIKELSKNHIESLTKNNINNREDLADLSVDELLEMIDLTKEDAGKIIMDAREPWFNQD